MPTRIIMPKWGMAMQEGKVSRWFKEPGDPVNEGEEIAEIESEKITNVIEAPASGTLAAVLVSEGHTAPIQSVLAYITAPDETFDPADLHGSPATPHAPDLDPDLDPDQATENDVPAPGSAPSSTGNGNAPTATAPAAPAQRGGAVRAAPVARRIARELGVDLATVQGSGPRGMIVADDVRRAAAHAPAKKPPIVAPSNGQAAPTMPPATHNGERAGAVRRVGFYSDVSRIAAMIYIPQDIQPAERRPGIVFCVGYTYLKEMVVSEMARAMQREGFVGVIFDYRGFGESEGMRGRLYPHEQVADVQAAVTFLQQQPEVDPQRISIVGLSLGGANAVAATATDPRVRAAVAIESPADGRRWLRSLRRHSEWVEFTRQIEQNHITRTLTGRGTAVDALEIMLPDPDSAQFLAQVYENFPQMRVELSLDSAAALLAFSPQQLAGGLGTRPLLIIHGDDDRLVPVEEARVLHAAVPHSTLDVVPGMGHFDWVMPDHPTFQQVMARIAAWCREQL